ncbi:MAG TPA: isopentenyl transferase family protein [Gaiella sp.]
MSEHRDHGDHAEPDDGGEGGEGADRTPAEVIAVFGPTASGKSAVAEATAARLGTDVISVDALQVYRGLPILTNQPTHATRLVAIRSLAEQMTVGEFAPLAHREIDAVVAAHAAAVVTGGTGLYLRAALTDLDLPPAVEQETVERAERAVDADASGAHARLGELDPAAAAAVHPNDRQRLVRALALAESGGSLARAVDRLWSAETRRPTLVVGLVLGAEELDRRIRERARRMFAAGVADEVRQALEQPLSRTVEKALGLREIAALPAGEALEGLVNRTRRYARYQQKWMRRIPGVFLLDGERDPDTIAGEILARAGLAHVTPGTIV